LTSIRLLALTHETAIWVYIPQRTVGNCEDREGTVLTAVKT